MHVICQSIFEEVFASPVCPNQITDIQFDKFVEHGTFKICVSAKGGVVQAYNILASENCPSDGFLPQTMKLDPIFSVKSPVSRPRSIGFVNDNSMQTKVRVLGWTGDWCVHSLHNTIVLKRVLRFVLNGSGTTISSKRLGHIVYVAQLSSFI